MTAKMLPKGISWKTWASVMNRSGGPEDTPAQGEHRRHHDAGGHKPGDGIENGDVLGGVHHVHISLEVTTVDERAAPRQAIGLKNAWPRAYTQVVGFSNASQRGTSRYS